jgi:hypothetical protein
MTETEGRRCYKLRQRFLEAKALRQLPHAILPQPWVCKAAPLFTISKAKTPCCLL